MPYRDPAQRKAAKQRYYASKGRVLRAQRYRESRQEPMHINPQPLAQALQHWKMQ